MRPATHPKAGLSPPYFFKMDNGEMVSATPETATIAIGHDYDDKGRLLKETWYAIQPKVKNPQSETPASKSSETDASQG